MPSRHETSSLGREILTARFLQLRALEINSVAKRWPPRLALVLHTSHGHRVPKSLGWMDVDRDKSDLA